MRIGYLVLFFTIAIAVISVQADQAPVMRHISGEIGWVDIQLGKLELNRETGAGTKTTEYRITENETRVTDSADEKFLNVDDLRAGQYITVEVASGQEDKVVPKIVVDPMPVSEFQQAFGEIKEIDAAAGTMAVEEKVRIGKEERSRLSYFVFDPEKIVVMQSPSKQPVGLALKPGDVVKVEYVEMDGKQQARYVTLYSPVVTTTTTTTVTTTQ